MVACHFNETIHSVFDTPGDVAGAVIKLPHYDEFYHKIADGNGGPELLSITNRDEFALFNKFAKLEFDSTSQVYTVGIRTGTLQGRDGLCIHKSLYLQAPNRYSLFLQVLRIVEEQPMSSETNTAA